MTRGVRAETASSRTALVFTLLMLLVLGVAACFRSIAPQAEVRTSNDSVSVSALFDVDGYRVYRFYDGGYYHYFTIPAGVTLGAHSENCGKSCTKTVWEEVATGRPR